MQIFTYTISPALPEGLGRLEELACNLWWCWHHGAIELFRRLDRDLWERTGHNPVRLLGEIAQERLEEAAREEGFLLEMDRVLEAFDRDMEREIPYCPTARPDAATCIAYFVAEFGLSECLPIYSGGLAMLAGDHLKAASDLGLPLVGVGLLYREGYFQQYLNEAGWQQETYAQNDFYTLPLALERDAGGHPVMVEVEYPDAPVRAQVWRVQVGRIPLYLLDADLESNRREDRQITAALYGGDMEMRIRQEILLGIGGVRALEVLGKQAAVCHMNEGHAAFLGLERIRRLMEDGELSFAEAREAVAAGTVFTTHTPVPAGIDIFPAELMERYFSDYARCLGLSWEEFLELGREAEDQGFSMAVLAIKLSQYCNAVSRLHAQVSRRMWRGLWPGLPVDEVPIRALTNGVHFNSWISHDMAMLYDRYLGRRWREEPERTEIWREVADIPGEEFWRTHERRRERLVAFVRRRLQQQLRRRGAPGREIALAAEVLDPEALTIGFGRRFAPYKRPTLLLRDPERLERFLGDSERPVQLIVAGKAHPRDEAGKALIQQVVQLARKASLRSRLVFVENYDMAVARYMVQGVDLWLNTPRRPNEACGTSGMKALVNGALNLSTLDGWWAEAYELDLGWCIGGGEIYEDENYQDEVEFQALYEILEREIVPLFYRREGKRVPRAWVERVQRAMGRLCPFLNGHRMVKAYAEELYRPALEQWLHCTADHARPARERAAWKRQLRAHWGGIRVARVREGRDGCRVGGELEVEAEVYLGELSPGDLAVELYYGRLGADARIHAGESAAMEQVDSPEAGKHLFRGSIPCRRSGRHGYALRIIPRSAEQIPGLVFWA